MPDQPTDAAQWRCGKCDGFDFPLHSPRCPLREPTDAGKDEATAVRLWEQDGDVPEMTRALSAAREEGRREGQAQERDRLGPLEAAVGYAMSCGCLFPVPEPRAGATTDELIKWGAMRNLHEAFAACSRAREPREEPSR